MSRIQLLSAKIANLIAAGEVVERPASVVKELIENSIDAQATKIQISFLQAGRTSISVIDNGIGMDFEDLQLAFVRHATSKIKSEHDLFRIQTLGFRGEALPSIASVAKVTAESATADGQGTRVVFENNHMITNQVITMPRGTKMIIEHLFVQTPARLKHLKSDFTEAAAIADAVAHAALGHPEIRFELVNEGRIIFRTPGNGNLADTIAVIYGTETGKQLIPLKGSNFDYKIEGYISNPTLTKSNRYSMTYLLNGRPVRLPIAFTKLMQSYHTFIPEGRYPVAVLSITTDPVLTDINVHPSKHEVRLSKEESLGDLIVQLTEGALRSIAFPQFGTATPMATPTTVTPVEIQYMPTGEITLFTPSPEQSFTIQEQIEQQIIPPTPQGFPMNLTPIAQLHQTYIIASSDQGFYLIDQHAAMERINYERLQHHFQNDSQKHQELMIPWVIELPYSDVLKLNQHLDDLLQVGIRIEVFGTQSVRVTRIPLWMVNYNERDVLDYALHRLIANQPISATILRDHAIATMSCKTSLKANKTLSLPEMEVLITRLSGCDNPFTCPHGRPTMVFYSLYNLEHTFKRV